MKKIQSKQIKSNDSGNPLENDINRLFFFAVDFYIDCWWIDVFFVLCIIRVIIIIISIINYNNHNNKQNKKILKFFPNIFSHWFITLGNINCFVEFCRKELWRRKHINNDEFIWAMNLFRWNTIRVFDL